MVQHYSHTKANAGHCWRAGARLDIDVTFKKLTFEPGDYV